MGTEPGSSSLNDRRVPSLASDQSPEAPGRTLVGVPESLPFRWTVASEDEEEEEDAEEP